MVVLKEVSNTKMFWALTLEKGSRYTQTVEKAFHLSMAALEDPGKKKEGIVGVMISTVKAEFLLCSLSHRTLYNQPLDLNFTEGEEVTFFLNGEGTVHLSGYQLEDEANDFDDYNDMMTDSDDDEDDAEVPTLVPAKGAKRKGLPTQDSAKKMKMDSKMMKKITSLDDDDDDDDESFQDDQLELDDDDDMEDDDDDDDDDEEEEVKPQKKAANKELSKVQTPKSDKSDKKKKENTEKPKTPAQEKQPPQTPSSAVTPGGDSTESSKKKKKKKKNKNKDSETPGKPDQQKQPDKQQKSGHTPQKKVLGGGVVMEEFNSGSGPVAQKGKMVHVYYVGKLQKDGKQFDSCTSGKPFKFRLGFKEVIPGWDKGLEGMKVGGKRRLIVPPKEGYGNQKQGPIPPNSTLIFDIELKSVT